MYYKGPENKYTSLLVVLSSPTLSSAELVY